MAAEVRRSADDGKAVELHEELVHEHAVLRVHLAVAVAELADVQAEALEHGVDIVDEGGEDAGEEERSVWPEADDMGTVQVGEVRHKGRVVLHEREIRFGELHAENVLMHAGKARQESLHVLAHGRLPVVRSARGRSLSYWKRSSKYLSGLWNTTMEKPGRFLYSYMGLSNVGRSSLGSTRG